MDDRGILSINGLKVNEWISDMVMACTAACERAESAAFGGVQNGKTVQDVVNKVNELKGAVLFQVELTNEAVRKFGHENTAIWPDAKEKLTALTARCERAAEVVQVALDAMEVGISRA